MTPWRLTFCAAVALSLAAPFPARAAGDVPYLYQRTGYGQPGGRTVELETAFGTREARPFGERGLEQGARFRAQVTDRLSVEGWGGALFDLEQGGFQQAAFWAEANVGVLRQEGPGIDLSVGGGLMRDFRGVVVPRVRLTAGRSWGALNLTASGLAEVPLAADRDPVDVIVGAAASYAVSGRARLGLEVVGEDLEGFWEAGEAEGGARLVAGPTLWLASGRHFEVKLNAGAVVATTRSVAVADPAVVAGADAGFLGRVAVGYVF